MTPSEMQKYLKQEGKTDANVTPSATPKQQTKNTTIYGPPVTEEILATKTDNIKPPENKNALKPTTIGQKVPMQGSDNLQVKKGESLGDKIIGVGKNIKDFGVGLGAAAFEEVSNIVFTPVVLVVVDKLFDTSFESATKAFVREGNEKVEELMRTNLAENEKAYYLGKTIGHVGGAAANMTGTILTVEATTAVATETVLSSGLAALSTGQVVLIPAGIGVAAGAIAVGTAVATEFMENGTNSYNQATDSYEKFISNEGSGSNVPDDVNFSNSQLGQKWGKHKFDYPDLKSHTDYQNLAKDIFKNYEQRIFDATNSEFYYIRGNDLLRVSLAGDFISCIQEQVRIG